MIIANDMDKVVKLKRTNAPKGKIPKAKYITEHKDRIEEAR